MSSKYIVTVLLLGMFVAGCGEKKAEPAKIEGLEKYTDASNGFSLLYPKNWTMKKTEGERLVALSSPEVESRFVTFKSGPAGAKIDLHIIKFHEGTLEQYINEDKIFQSDAYTGQEKVSLAVGEAVKISYSAEDQDGKFKGEKYYALRDTVLTTLEFAAFGSTYEAYSERFAEILKSFVPGGPTKQREVKVDTVKQEIEKPSTTLSPAPGSGYSISIPDNFHAKGVKAAGAIGGSEYLGARLDCTIRVDILDASKQSNLDKIATENKAAFSNAPQSSTTLGGVKAYKFNYSPAKGISRYAYLCVKDGKLYRVFVTWNDAERDTYVPIFEKCIASFQFK